jgi:large subunit ribosomal protein L24
VVKKHVKPSTKSAGGIETKELPIHVSNVAILDPKTQKPTRVGMRILEDGQKVRYSKRSDEVIK